MDNKAAFHCNICYLYKYNTHYYSPIKSFDRCSNMGCIFNIRRMYYVLHNTCKACWRQVAKIMNLQTVSFITFFIAFGAHLSKSNDAGPVTFDRLDMQIKKISKSSLTIVFDHILLKYLYIKKLKQICKYCNPFECLLKRSIFLNSLWKIEREFFTSLLCIDVKFFNL